jgi:hypothetical protein
MSDTTVEKKGPQLFGHPLGLTYLFTTEMAERFSYYGMRAILVLYLTNFLLLHPAVDGVIGYSAIKHLLELIFNAGRPLGVQPLSSAIYGAYTALVYLTPFFGGIIADRWLGQRRSVLVGGVIMAAGEFVLMLPQFAFVGLLMLIIGNGFFKPNISTQVGNLYKPGDSRIDRAYSIFYVGINVGAFFSPLICGSLGESPSYGYHWGFFAAGVGMVRVAHAAAGSHFQSQIEGHGKKATDGERCEIRHRHCAALYSGHLFLGDVRATGQHDQSVGAGFHQPSSDPRRDRLGNSRDVVPGVQPVHDFCFHAAGRERLGHAIEKRPRAVHRDEDGPRIGAGSGVLSRHGLCRAYHRRA